MTTSSILGPDGKPITKVDSEAMEKQRKKETNKLKKLKSKGWLYSSKQGKGQRW